MAGCSGIAPFSEVGTEKRREELHRCIDFLLVTGRENIEKESSTHGNAQSRDDTSVSCVDAVRLERGSEWADPIVDDPVEHRLGPLPSLEGLAVDLEARPPEARWTVTALEPGRSFTWQTSSRGVTTVGGHAVEADGGGAVITLTLHQHGPFAWLAKLMAGRLAREYVSMELEGFRRGAESRSASA